MVPCSSGAVVPCHAAREASSGLCASTGASAGELSGLHISSSAAAGCSISPALACCAPGVAGGCAAGQGRLQRCALAGHLRHELPRLAPLLCRAALCCACQGQAQMAGTSGLPGLLMLSRIASRAPGSSGLAAEGSASSMGPRSCTSGQE